MMGPAWQIVQRTVTIDTGLAITQLCCCKTQAAPPLIGNYPDVLLQDTGVASSPRKKRLDV